MAEGITNELLLEATVVAILAALLMARDVPLIVTALVVLVRVGLSTAYFAWCSEPWTMLDDLSYFNDGGVLLRMGFNPLSALLTVDGFDELCAMCGGHHILYSWWNLTAQYLFGEYYFAPVFLNVLATFVTGTLIGRTARLAGCSQGYAQGLQVFFLLHWEVVAWSSLVNLKDCLVQLLTVAAMYYATRFFRYRDLTSVVGFVATLPVFYWIRFYIPLLVGVAVVIWMVFQWHDKRKFLLAFPAMFGAKLGWPMLQNNLDGLSPGGLLVGSLRFLVTPLPWSVIDGYSFLTIPSTLHLVFLLPAACGMFLLWRDSVPARMYLIYCCLIIGLYSMTDELQEPRHRFQIAFIFAWIQFHFLWSLRPVERAVRVPAPIIQNRRLAPGRSTPQLAA